MNKLFVSLISLLVAFSAFAVQPTTYSDQLTLLNAGDTVIQADAGDVVTLYFTETTTALTNQSCALVLIPANTRIIDGEISVAAMGGSETFDLGLIGADGNGYINDGSSTADDVDLFLDGISASNAVADTFANIVAGDSNSAYAGHDKDVYLAITAPAGGAVWVADKAIKGWVQYIK